MSFLDVLEAKSGIVLQPKPALFIFHGHQFLDQIIIG
ncbi:hypothetical protein U771_26170 [Pseudomonas gorinensis]|uniref:Uncharacterized protein n=1 Tax=Pseudomonas gorinensis TaxID=3240790 RepID=A0ACA7PCN9_9PSED|nr:hypothetical protein U771_26170 [Pseudomonas sp. TKP]